MYGFVVSRVVGVVALALTAALAMGAADTPDVAAASAPTSVADTGCEATSAADDALDGTPVAAARTGAPVGVSDCADLRPGAQITIPGRGTCTVNFLFTGRDPREARHHYAGTAGHCAIGEGPTDTDAGERVWRTGQGPAVEDAQGDHVGRFTYAVLDGDFDFGLIRIAPGVATGPTMCHFGGPTGVNRDRTSATTPLEYYGQGLAIGTVAPARTAVAQGMPHPRHVHATGPAVFGDSGAPVLSSDGRAVGHVVTTGLHTGQVDTSGVDYGTIGISRIAPVANRAARALNQHLTLRRGVR